MSKIRSPVSMEKKLLTAVAPVVRGKKNKGVPKKDTHRSGCNAFVDTDK